jgi:hypothetical protein
MTDAKRANTTAKTWWLVGGSLAFFLLVVAAFWAVGLFDQPDDDSGAKTLVAVVALVGVLFTETVGVLGLLLKDAIDQRAADLRVQEVRQSEVDVVIRAVNLLGENNKLSDPHQVGGAVLALETLGHIDLALALVHDLWPVGGITDSVGLATIRAGLAPSSSPAAQNSAGHLLFLNSEKITREGGYDWPIDDASLWPHHLIYSARLAVVFAAAFWMRDAVTTTPGDVPDAALTLYSALDDENLTIRSIAATTLDAMNGHIPEDRGMVYRTGFLSMGDIAERISNIDTYVVDDQRLVLLVSDIHQAFSVGDGGAEPASTVDE